MEKRKFAKKLSIHKETLQRLEPGDLQQAAGGTSWASDCRITCGDDSCLWVCSLNCSWLCLAG